MYNSKKILPIFLTAIMAISLVAPVMYAPVIAEAPTIALSKSSGYVRDWVTVTGKGFAGDKDVVIKWFRDDVEVATVGTTIADFRYPSLRGGAGSAARTDSSGSFIVDIRVPIVKGGMYTIKIIVDGEVKAKESFTVLPNVEFLDEDDNPVTEGMWGDSIYRVRISGFPADVAVTLSPSEALSGFGTPSTGSTIGTNEGQVDLAPNIVRVGEQPRGIQTLKFEGGGISVSKTFNYISCIELNTLSITRSPGITLGIKVHGFGKEETIPADSITIGGASTIHPSKTTKTNGSFDDWLSVTLASQILTLGEVPIIIAGATFNLANGNIKGDYPLLIASDPPPEGVSTATIRTHKAEYKPGDTVKVWGAGFRRNETLNASIYFGGALVSIGTSDIDGSKGDGNIDPDARGAWYAKFTLPNVARDASASDRCITLSVNTPGDNPAPREVTIVPKLWIRKADDTDYLTSGDAGTAMRFKGFGFAYKGGEAKVDIKFAGVLIKEDIPVNTDGTFDVTETLPDKIPGVTEKAEAAEKGFTTPEPLTVKATKDFTVKVKAQWKDDNGNNIVEVNENIITPTNHGPIGTLLGLTPARISGLKANTVYQVVWGLVDGVVVREFTSTSEGKPPFGISWRVPSTAGGLTIIDIVEKATGKSAIRGKLATPRGNSQFAVGGPEYKLGGGTTDSTDVGGRKVGLVFYVLGSVSLAPTAGYVGTEVIVSAIGLKPLTSYKVAYESALNIVAEFKTTELGAIPVGVKFTVPVSTTNPGEERTGTSKTIMILDELGATVAEGTFTLYSSISIDKKSGSAGTVVTVTGSGFAAGSSYHVHWGGDLHKPTPEIGIVLTSFTATLDGEVPPGVQFTVPPDASAGTYYVDIATADFKSCLVVRPIFTVVGVPPPELPGTKTFTPSAPALLDAAGRETTAVMRGSSFYTRITLKNNVATQVSVYVISQIKDAKGSVIAVGMTMADVGAEATRSVPVAFLGIATPGTYTVTIYVWSDITAPTALAPTTTFTITVS